VTQRKLTLAGAMLANEIVVPLESTMSRVLVTRGAGFSAAHNFWIPTLSREENARLFGIAARESPHGHNYRILLTIAGDPDPKTGMVVNISEVAKLLEQSVVHVLRDCWINRDVPAFLDTIPTLENVALFAWGELSPGIPGTEMVRLVVAESDELWVDYEPTRKEGAMLLTRRYEFSASHRLYSPHFSEEENVKLFGACSNPHGHGHNYAFEVSVTGQIDPKSGMLADLAKLDECVGREVLDYLDHKHLNLDLPDFKELVSTTENVTRLIWRRLVDKVPAKLARVIVRETSNNVFEYSGE
jgi:6-pyruvoyltetrahydropterin/6-carboxytetrahydropterin synthase